ncbi:hypothetical protein SK128_020895, partial [Halocaridina rubra]
QIPDDSMEPHLVIKENYLRRFLEVIAISVCTALLIFQVQFNLMDYLSKPTVLRVSLLPNNVIRLPSVSVCPYPPFRPDRLIEFGADVTGSYMEVENNLASLKGIQKDLKVSHLWTEAGWSLGQVIDTVTLQNSSIRFNSSTTISPNWYRSYSPLGPCFTFIPPPRETSIIIHLVDTPYIKPCTLGITNCETLEKHCNLSCGYEDYLKYMFHAHDKAFLYFHDSATVSRPKSESEDDVITFTKNVFRGKFVVVELEKEAGLRSQVHLVDKSMLGESCNSDGTYSVGECYLQEQKVSIENTLGCTPVEVNVFNSSLNATCSAPYHILRMAALEKHVEGNCTSKCKSKAWHHDITDIWMSKFTIFLTTSSNDIRKEEEVETYPLSQLISDTGGSLGLFLSISALFGLNFVVKCIHHLSYKKLARKDPHFGTVMKLIGVLLLLATSFVHCLEVLKLYMTQPQQTSAKVSSTPVNMCSSINDSIVRRLASRTLGCKTLESPYNDKLTRCLLLDALNEVTHVALFLNLEDLPFCNETQLQNVVYEYIIPSEIIMAATSPKRMKKCQANIKDTRAVHMPDHSKPVTYVDINYSYYPMDLIQMFCSFGGVIGLYFGVSVYGGLDFVAGYFHSGKESKLHTYICYIRWTIKLLLLILSFCFIFYIITKFIVYKAFTASVMSRGTSESKPLTLIICRWPPLDFNYINKALSLNLSESVLLKMTKHKRISKVIKELELLQGNWNTSLENLWKEASWKVQDIISIYAAYLKNGQTLWDDCEVGDHCADRWPRIMTMLNHCISWETTGLNSTLSKILFTFPRDVEKRDVFDFTPQIYFAVGHEGDPLLLSSMIAKKPFERVIASIKSVSYKSLSSIVGEEHSQNRTYSECVNHCIYQIISRSYNCYLPYMPQTFTEIPCNQSVYGKIHKYYKGLHILGDDWDGTEDSVDTYWQGLHHLRECYISCRHLHVNFYEWSVERIPDPYPSIEVHFPNDDSLTLKETNLYTVSQLISDIGGLAGLTVGLSLLMLLKNIIPVVVNGHYFKKR